MNIKESNEIFFYYFAYGSCMNKQSLSDSLQCNVEPYFVGPGTTNNFRLIFNYPGINEPVCYANICYDEGCVVEGALFHLPIKYLKKIDEREGVPLGRYQRCTLNVLSNGREIENTISYRSSHTLDSEAAPSRRYIELICKGLIEVGVSKKYRKKTISHMNSLPPRL